MSSKSVTCATSFLLFALPPAARAATVTVPFSGTVDSLTDTSGKGYVPSGIRDGSSYVGTVTFNNAAAARSTDATDGYYGGTDLDMTVSVTVAGKYQYVLTTPSSSDEIDLEGSSFGLFKRGPTAYTSFAPDPPFSHLDLELRTDADVLSDLTAADVTLGTTPTSDVSDAQTSGASYYDVGAALTAVPEPDAAALAVLAVAGLVGRRRRVSRA